MSECPALPTPVTLTTPPFPSAYPTPFTPDAKLQNALTKAMNFMPSIHPTLANLGVALVALKGNGKHVVAHHHGENVYFGASMLKVAAAVGLLELRTALRAIAEELDCHTTAKELLPQAERYLKPKILAYVKAKLPMLSHVPVTQLSPQLRTTYKAVPRADGTFTVDFADRFAIKPYTTPYTPTTPLERMIVASEPGASGTCIHACGYGYLAGSSSEAGHFDSSSKKGMWLAGDYQNGYARADIVDWKGDKRAQASTPLAFARLLTLLVDKKLFRGEAAANGELLDLMKRGADEGYIYTTRQDDRYPADRLRYRVLQVKLGHAKLGSTEHYSEAAVLEHRTGARFVLVWMNLIWEASGYDELDALSHGIRDAIEEYLA